MTELTVILTTQGVPADFASLLHEYHSTAAGLTPDFALILVNDGDPDNLQGVLAAAARYSNVTIIDLAFPVGCERDKMEALRHCDSSWIYLPGLAEKEPADILRHCWRAKEAGNGEADVYFALGLQRGPVDRLFRALFGFACGVRVPVNMLSSRLVSRRFAKALTAFPERNLYAPGLWELAGFKQSAVSVPVRSASVGRVWPMIDAITSFSGRPLVLIFAFAAVQAVLCLIFSALVVWLRVSGHVGVPGWASIMSLVSGLSGAILFSLGLLGLYVSRIYLEVKARPNFIVSAVQKGEAEP